MHLIKSQFKQIEKKKKCDLCFPKYVLLNIDIIQIVLRTNAVIFVPGDLSRILKFFFA